VEIDISILLGKDYIEGVNRNSIDDNKRLIKNTDKAKCLNYPRNVNNKQIEFENNVYVFGGNS